MVPWGAITGGLGLGATALGGLFDKETPGEYGAQWLQNPQYGWSEGNLKGLYDYFNQGMSSIQQGKPPSWYQQYEAATKPRQQSNLYQTYFGGNWGPGIMDSLKSYNIQSGVPVGKRGSLMGKQLSDYATQSQKIDEFYSQLGANAMQSSEQLYSQGRLGLGQFQGPQGSWMSYSTPGSYQPSWLTGMGQGLTTLAPYANEMWGGK